MSSGIIDAYELDKLCEYPNCDTRFIPRTVRARFCPEHRGSYAGRSAKRAGPWQPEFIAIDGEGSGRGADHRYVLLGCGQEQIEWTHGVRKISDIFGFLYGQYLLRPAATYVGFYLGYDFNMWLRMLPRERAAMLLTTEGRAKRVRRVKGARLAPHPVEFAGWQFDILGMKRLKLRPKQCHCPTVTCRCVQAPWMYINDAGPFFQASLLTVIDPKDWTDPVVTQDEYNIVKAGKEKRDSAILDDEMKYYNRLENDILARVMTRLNVGLTAANVKLRKTQWFGPGQAAQAWMALDKKLDATTAALQKLPTPVREAAIATYYGGWFEIPVHGYIPGTVYEYDINSAYPSIAAKLPCLCGSWRTAKGRPRSTRTGQLRMCRVIVEGRDPYLGPLPYRTKLGGILRPQYTEGWYWQHEINAAREAGLIHEITYLEYIEYTPCNHPAPLRGLAGLYDARQRIGKDTPEGKAYKLVYNSVYGKLAQSLGEPIYANPIYASLITAGCRTMILNAIATHPEGSKAVAMVATDGVYFLSMHSGLPISDRLGEWGYAEKHNLTVFKPGVYWDDKARDSIRDGQSPRFKARGINARDFASSIERIDDEFKAWSDDVQRWPSVQFRSGFTQVSVLQAIRWTDGNKDERKYYAQAGRIYEDKALTQDSNPIDKRDTHGLHYDGRVWRTAPWKGGPHWPASQPYEKRFGLDDDTAAWNEYVTPDGPVMMNLRHVIGVG